MPGFSDVVKLHWNNNPFHRNMAKNIAGNFKQLRKGLKAWSKEASRLSKLINNCNWVLGMLDGLEDQRPLSLVEANFRKIIKNIFFLCWKLREFIGNRELHYSLG